MQDRNEIIQMGVRVSKFF